MTSRPLEGVSIVVTRAAHQAGALADRLDQLGAVPVLVPLLTIVDADDGGAALARAADEIAAFDWVAVTSPNGVARLAAVVDDWTAVRQIAVVGPGTAASLEAAGRHPDLVPERAVAEALLAALPAPPPGGRILVVQAELARPVLVDSLAERGWDVESVVAYRAVSADLADADRDRSASADAITFASSSAVTAFVDADGGEICPETVACIGPITAETARRAGLDVTLEADPHTIDGLVAALAGHYGVDG